MVVWCESYKTGSTVSAVRGYGYMYLWPIFQGYLDNLSPILSGIIFVNIYNKNDSSFLRVVLHVSYYYFMIFERFGNKSM